MTASTLELTKILSRLQWFADSKPQLFDKLCNSALDDGETTLGDALSALQSAIAYLEGFHG